MAAQPRYKKVLLKLSGEALMGDTSRIFDAAVIKQVSNEIAEIRRHGVRIGIVIGGGNILRGQNMLEIGIDRATADYMGMLATVINSLAIQNALQECGVPCHVLSALEINRVVESFSQFKLNQYLNENKIVIFAAGTGNPYFTTDSAASLRAAEMSASLMLKATKVDGVYNEDPKKNSKAVRYKKLTYQEVLINKLGVMDATAITLCRDNNIPIRVFNLFNAGDAKKIIFGEEIGTLIARE